MKLFLVPTSDYFAVISITALLITLSSETSAKRGCTAFGHSCYGGHGKRADLNQHLISLKDRNNVNGELPEYVHVNDQERAERRISDIDKNKLGDDPLSIIIRQLMIGRHRPFAGAGSTYRQQNI